MQSEILASARLAMIVADICMEGTFDEGQEYRPLQCIQSMNGGGEIVTIADYGMRPEH